MNVTLLFGKGGRHDLNVDGDTGKKLLDLYNRFGKPVVKRTEWSSGRESDDLTFLFKRGYQVVENVSGRDSKQLLDLFKRFGKPEIKPFGKTQAASAVMDPQTTHEVVATLIKAGRRDLARVVAGES